MCTYNSCRPRCLAFACNPMMLYWLQTIGVVYSPTSCLSMSSSQILMSVHVCNNCDGREWKSNLYALFDAPPQLGQKRIHVIRTRGGNKKYRALRLDNGNFSWGSEGPFVIVWVVVAIILQCELLYFAVVLPPSCTNTWSDSPFYH